MQIEIKPIDGYPVTIPYGFTFPAENADLTYGTAEYVKIFPPEVLDCGATEDGKKVRVEIIAAILGENHRSIVPDTYTSMGLWLCKDFIKIERRNNILEAVFGGQYYYRSFLILANCQNFDLTANRNDIRTDQEEYDLAINAIKEHCRKIWESSEVQGYFECGKDEQNEKDTERRKKEEAARRERADTNRKTRLNRYNGRPDLKAKNVLGAPLKEPQSEAETALLLQAMISNKHPAIDFVIGDYSTAYGVDLVVEQDDKGIRTLRWAELVSSLDKLFQWAHPPEGFHIVICYQLGKTAERQTFTDGTVCQLVKTSDRGRYLLVVGASSMQVYVLKELLEAP